MSGVPWWLAVPVILAALVVAGFGVLALHVRLTRPPAGAVAAARPVIQARPAERKVRTHA